MFDQLAPFSGEYFDKGKYAYTCWKNYFNNYIIKGNQISLILVLKFITLQN